MSFTGYFYLSSAGHVVQQSGTILAIYLEGHPKNISVELF